jgi:hypothetical protein
VHHGARRTDRNFKTARGGGGATEKTITTTVTVTMTAARAGGQHLRNRLATLKERS